MSLLQPELTTLHKQSTGSKIAGPALVAGAALVLVGAGVALGTRSTSPPPPIDRPVADPCAVPTGIEVSNLDVRDQSLMTRRLLACGDLYHGRIIADDYRKAIAAIDEQWDVEQPEVPEEPEAPELETLLPQASIVWASKVRGFSSQYTTSSWSAAQVLGAPDVFPGTGDNEKAWASLGADDQNEWLEVGFDNPGSISTVKIYETFNAGALDRVELITATGRVIKATPAGLEPSGDASAIRNINVSCTTEPVIAVRVHIASMKVEGWNEIDAIGVVPCKR